MALSDAGYTDDPNDDLLPQLEEGDTDGDGILDVGETWIFEASETVSQGQIDAGDALTNVATVTTAETDPVTAEETVTVAQAPGIALDKTADRDVVTATGQTVTYTYTVENTGNVSLNDVTIVDDAGTPGIRPTTSPSATTVRTVATPTGTARSIRTRNGSSPGMPTSATQKARQS